MLKNHVEYETDASTAKFTAISRQVSPASLQRVSADYYQRPLVDESEIIRTQMGNAQ
jgi:hypothetical protein